MAKKHFDAYYENYKNYYLATVDMAENLIKEMEAGKVTPERAEAYKRDAEPIVHTFRILQEVKRILDRPARPKKRAVFERQTKRIVPLTEENDLEAIQDRAEKAVERLNDLME